MTDQDINKPIPEYPSRALTDSFRQNVTQSAVDKQIINYHTLRHIDLLDGIETSIIEKFESLCSWRDFTAGQTVLEQDEERYSVYFLTRGTVRVVNYSRSGKEVSLTESSSGNMFGELGAIDGRPRSASIIALTDVSVGIMPSKAFRQILINYPMLAFRIMRRLSIMVRNSTERILELATLNANCRVISELLRMADSYLANPKNKEADGYHVILLKNMPTHTQVANRIGTTRETVSRVISMLIRRKIMNKSVDGIEIVNYDAMIDLLDEMSET